MKAIAHCSMDALSYVLAYPPLSVSTLRGLRTTRLPSHPPLAASQHLLDDEALLLLDCLPPLPSVSPPLGAFVEGAFHSLWGRGLRSLPSAVSRAPHPRSRRP